MVTLGYLAVETRQNTLAIQATVRHSMLAEDRELLFKQMDYAALFTMETGDMSPEEMRQATSWGTTFLRTREYYWLQYQAGVIDERTWLSYRGPVLRILGEGGFEFVRLYWQRYSQDDFDPGFVEHVEELLASG